jgi:hypothetical protein
MGKIVKAVLVIAAAVAIIAFAPEIAGAIGFMAQGFALTAATVAAISSALVGIALSVGLSAAMSLFQKTPNLSQSLADRQDLNPDPTAPRKMVFGNTAAGTDIRFKESWGKKSDRLSLVIALASHQLTSVQTISMDAVKVWDSSQNGVNGNDVRGNQYDDGYDEVTPYLVGTPTNGRAVGTGNFWNRSSTFTGCAYSVITYRCDKTKVWTNGLPSKVIHVVEGCPVYDPRADSTNGGSGTQRPDNQATWQYRVNSVAVGRNPALCLLTYLIGWRVNGILMWGMGLPIDAIEMSSFIQYANLCEEQVQTSTGGTTQRYTCDGIFSTNDSHQTITNSICLCMGTAILVDTNGLFQIIEGYDDTLTTPYALTQDDVISSGVWTPSPEVRNRVTRVSGRFADPSQQYTLTTWGTVDVDPFFDGIPRVQTTDFNCVGRAETCQRIAKQLLVKSKYCGVYTAVFGYRAFAATVGSLVTLSGVHGFNNKLFRVTGSEETFDLTYQLTLREESPEVYEWDASEEKPLPANIFQTTFDAIDAEDVEGLTINSTAVEGTNSVTTIFVDVNWTPATSLRTTSIEIQSQKLGDNVWTVEAERFNPLAGTFRFGAGVNGAGILVQARYRMDNGAYGPWVTANLSSTPVSNTNQWSSVYDNGDGTKPADSATNTRDPSTPLGGGGDTVGTIVNQTGDNTAALTDPSTSKLYKISDIVANVDDLTNTYGSTSSAAASAAAAAASQSAAATAATNAQQASDNATTAKNAASASETAADAAKAAALGYQTGAQAAQTAAGTSATNAATANTNAQAAVTAANSARDLALSYQTGAQTAKTAAETAATNASTSAGTASSQATLAAGANSAANAAAASLFPERLDGTSASFSNAQNALGSPSSIVPIASSAYVAASGYGSVAQFTLPAVLDVSTVGVLPFTTGRFYKMEWEYQVTSIGAGDTIQSYGYMRNLDGSYVLIGSAVTSGAVTISDTSVHTYSYVWGCNATGGDFDITSTGVVWLRPVARLQSLAKGSVVQFRRVKVTDVTSQILAGQSAGAASTSATNASASATTASQQATIATNQATTATTKAGDASTYASNAAASATTAQGAATTATTQAGIATTAKGDAQTAAGAAQTSATAAAGSASTASSKADAASASATSASSSATTATTQAGNAQTYAGQASTSATNAQGYANSASTQAGVASTAATNANTALDLAQTTTASIFPSLMAQNQSWWATSTNMTPIGAPLTLVNGTTGAGELVPNANFTNVTGVGYVYDTLGATALTGLYPVGAISPTPGSTYEFEVMVRCLTANTVSGATITSVLDCYTLDASYNTVADQGTNVAGFTNTDAGHGAVFDWTVWKIRYVAPATGLPAYIRPRLYFNYRGSGTATQGNAQYQVQYFKITDITQALAAATSASAAATSASNAATSATAAGTSATSASNSATTATTAAGTAQTYASNASTSATNASGSANTATTQAGVATSSANTAALTAAQTLPTDFTQQGQYWFSGFQGSPTAALATAVSTAVSFPTVTGLGPVALVAPAVGANVDTSMAGVLTVAPGRIYQLTVTYEGKTASSGLFVNPFIIGLNASYNYVAVGSTSVNVPVADTSLHTATVQIHGDTVIAAGCNAIRALLRVGISAGGAAGGSAYLVSGVLEDITAQTQAAASATAAAGSASSAATSQTAAGQSATAAAASATQASTSAGQAQTYSSNASTSATNAAGSATSATTQAGVSASSASAAQAAAMGTFPTTFEQGATYFGGDTGNPTPVNMITATSSDGLPVLQTNNNTTYGLVSWEQAMPYTAGRTYKITAKIKSTTTTGGTCQLRISVYDVSTGGVRAGLSQSAYLPVTTAWQTFTSTATATVTGSFVRPEVVLNYNPVTNGVVQQIALIQLEDITESTLATAQATAAATSASNAAISATIAGTSASSAQSSATTASTQASNAAGSASSAQTYAGQASTSASNAQGYSNTASTQAGAASTSATNASNSATAAAGSATTASTQATNASNSATAASSSNVSAQSAASTALSTAAALLPQDFQQDGTFWSNAYAGAPTRASLAASGNFVYPASGNYVTIHANAGASTTDIANLGALPLVAGRTYSLSANYTVTNIGTGGTSNAQIYYIPLNASYAYTSGGAAQQNITANGTFNVSVTFATNSLLSVQPTSTMFRALFRINGVAGSSGVVVQLNTVIIDDITDSLAASNSATAAANSATSATASANAATGSATSASTSANTAVTQAGNAQNSATAAAGSAATSASNAAAASSSATLAAAVGSGDTNLNSMFGNWPTATAFPTNWTDASNVTGHFTRVAGITSAYAMRITSAAGANTYMDQTGANAPWDCNVGDWIILEADILLNAGSLIGSGVLFRIAGSAEIELNFGTDLASGDAVVGAGVAGNPYSFRKLIQITAGGNTSTQFFAMNAWSGFGSIAGSNDITWYRCGWRPATSAEIAGKRADSNASTALSQITQEQSTRAAADAALTTSVTNLNAYVNTNANMLFNPTGANGLNGWTQNAVTVNGEQGSGEGYYFQIGSGSFPGNSYPGFYQDVPVVPGVAYSLQGLVYAGGVNTTAVVRLYMEFLNTSKAHLGYSDGGNVQQIAGGNGWTSLITANEVTPANTNYIRVHCDVGSSSAFNITNIAWRRMKLEQAPICTSYSDDGTAAQLSASVSTQAGAIASIQGKTQAYWQTTVNAGAGQAFISATALDQNGNPTSSVGIGATDIAFYNPSGGNYIKALEVSNGNISIAGDFYGGAGKMVWSNGSVMKVQGTGFGTSNQFIEWFGPNMDISQCWEGNATYYLRTDGSAYFGGSISAGNATTKASTTDQGASATAETNPFSSHGGTITVVLSYNAGYSQRASYSPSQGSSFMAAANAIGATTTDGSSYSASGSDPGGFSVDLYRSLNGAGYVKVATLAGTGSWSWRGLYPESGDPGNANITDSQAGSITYTDPDHVAQNRQYKAILTARNPKFGITTQQVSIVCNEQ